MHMGCVLLNYVLEHVKADSSYRELTMKDPDSVHTHWFKLSVWGGGLVFLSCFCDCFGLGAFRSGDPRQKDPRNLGNKAS